MKQFDCPFCHNPSAVSEGNQFFCFSCGMGGDRISYLRAFKGISYKEAAEKLGTVLLDEVDRGDKKEKVLQALAEAEEFFFSSAALCKASYFKKRKLNEETVKTFRLGYSEGGNRLYKFLLKKGIEEEVMEEADLICRDEETGDVYDKFWKRIIFPIRDANGRTIGFGGRVLKDEKPKYLNSSESIVFDKSHNLYAMDIAKDSNEDYLLLAEGYVDVISLHQNGFTNAVASLGTSFTFGQAELISKYKKSVYIVYDNDMPGQNAAEKAASVLLKKGLDVKVVSVAPYKDVDELLVAEGAEEFKKHIESAVSGKAFLTRDKTAEEIAAFLFANC